MRGEGGIFGIRREEARRGEERWSAGLHIETRPADSGSFCEAAGAEGEGELVMGDEGGASTFE